MEYETILKQTQNHAIPGGEQYLLNDRNVCTPSNLHNLYPFAASGYFATRNWCKENAKIIRYLQSHTYLYMHGGRFWEYPFVFKRVMERPNSRIIDIGIGEGVFASILSKHGHHVTGVDNYASCWQDLKNTMEKTQIPCINADARNLGMLKDNQFDIALLISAIEHIPSNTIWCEKRKVTKTGDMLRSEIPEKLQVISEALRVVKPGGLVFITSDIYLDYPQEMNISWKELFGVEGIDRENFSDLNEIYLSDNPIHKGREVSVAIVVEKHGQPVTGITPSPLETVSLPFLGGDPEDATLAATVDNFIQVGENHFSMGEYDKAKVCFQNALSENPNHKEAFNNLGVIAFAEGVLEEAETFFQKAAQIDHTYMDALENLGRCAEIRKDYTSAIGYFEKAINLDNKNIELLNKLGNLYLQLEKLEEAENVYERSIQAGPQQESVRKILSEFKFLHKTNRKTVAVKQKAKLNIGFISVWYERGQAYVTKSLRDALAVEHHAFVLARTGAVYPDQPQLETTDFWEVPNLSTYPVYDIPSERVEEWIIGNDLDVVVFNEEYDWQLVEHCKKTGVKLVTYLDYYKEEWKPYLRLYDAVLCSTKRSFNLVKNDCNAWYVGWGIDTELYRPSDELGKKHTFFHNAGWLGINYRKMTPAVISAFDSISRDLEDATLFIHSQAPLHKLPDDTIHIVSNNPSITFHQETVPAPGLYAKGEVHVFPSKLEGLGLPLLEGLSCGLPTIATDAPPMNEFVKDGENGLLVKVAQTMNREDNIAFPETIADMDDLSCKMRMLAKDPDLRFRMSKKARISAEEVLSFSTFRERIGEVFRDLTGMPIRS